MKYINVKGIGILVVILLVFQFAVGMVLSPIVGKIVVDVLNKTSDARIEVGRISLWPLTLGISMSGLRVFDPDNDKNQIISVKKASIRLSPVALLSKRLVVAGINATDVRIDLEGESDGSFNVSKIVKAEGPGGERPKTSILDRFKKDRDMFSSIFDMLKNRNSSGEKQKTAEQRKEAGKVKTSVVQLPKGRRVTFRVERDDYLVEVKSVNVRLATIKVKDAAGEEIDIDRATLALGGLKIDPAKGATMDSLEVRGDLKKGDEPAGSFRLSYDTSYTVSGVRTDAVLSAKQVDLPAVTFLFEDSLPVAVDKGIITIDSRTRIDNGALDSRNRLTLVDHTLEPKGQGTVAGIIPMPVLCDALNQTDPLKLDFDITGTVDSPQFSGLDKTLKEIAEPYLTKQIESTAKSALEGIIKKDTGGAATGGDASSSEKTAEETIQSIKSLFGKE